MRPAALVMPAVQPSILAAQRRSRRRTEIQFHICLFGSIHYPAKMPETDLIVVKGE